MIGDLVANPVVVITAAVWGIAETIKYLTATLSGRRARFFEPGGMPSVHAAVMAAAVAVLGLDEGTGSAVFGLGVILAAIVFHDAYRVRWAAGQTAERLNELIAEGRSRVRPTVVWRGHRIREIAVGGLIGGALAAALHTAFYA